MASFLDRLFGIAQNRRNIAASQRSAEIAADRIQQERPRYGVLRDERRRNSFVNELRRKPQNELRDFAKFSVAKTGTGAGLGVARSAVGTAQGASGLFDLATPGKGTNRVSKLLNEQAKQIDRKNEQIGDKTAYKALQLGTDLATFGAVAKGAQAIGKAPKIAKAVKPLTNSKPNRAINTKLDKAISKGGKKSVVATGVKYAKKPANQVAMVQDAAFNIGQPASKGEDISKTDVAIGVLPSIAMGVGGPMATQALKVGAKGSKTTAVKGAKKAKDIQVKQNEKLENAIIDRDPELRERARVTRPTLQKQWDKGDARTRKQLERAIKENETAIRDRINKTKQGGYVSLGDANAKPNNGRKASGQGKLKASSSPSSIAGEQKTVRVYHGTTENFDKLKISTIDGRHGENQIPGIYTTPHKETAEMFAEHAVYGRARGGLKEGDVTLNNPLRFTNYDDLSKKLGVDIRNNLGAVPKLAQVKGYDGLIREGGIASKYGKADEYILFSPDQLRTPGATQPTKGAKTKRSQLTGKALNLTDKELAMGKALGLSPSDVANAKKVDPLAQLPRRSESGYNLQSRQRNQSLQGSAGKPSSYGRPVQQRTTQPNLQQPARVQTGELPVNRSFGNDTINTPDSLGTNGYPVAKKVNPIDYVRTPENVLRKIGLEREGQALLKADHQYKIELPQEIDNVSNWYDRVGRSQDASQRIFKWLDGQKGAKLEGEELAVGKEIKQYLSDWADRLGLPKEKRISNYITHIFDKELVMKEFDPDLEKLIADKVPGSVYDPFTMQRLGKQGYKEDAFLALDAYVKRGVRKANMDPALAQLKSASEGLDKSGLDYVKRLGDKINMRPGEIDSLIDNMVKQSPIGYKLGQRPTNKVTRAIRTATYRGTLGLNVGSAVRNLTQGVNTFAELGSKYTTSGYTQALKTIASKSDELSKTGVLDNSFIEDRTVSAVKKNIEKMDKALWFFFDNAEKINRGAAYFGAKQKALDAGKSLDEAIAEGVKVARKTQFTFGRVDTPVLMQNDIVKVFTQFQSFNVKQTEFIAGLVKNKEYAKLGRFLGATAFMMTAMGQALNYKPTDFVPFSSDLKEGNAPLAKTPVFQMGKSIIKGDLDRAAEAAGATFIPGFTQAKKSIQGIDAVNKGQFKKYGEGTVTVDQSTGNYIKAGIFGKSALDPTGKVEKGKTTSTKESKGKYSDMKPEARVGALKSDWNAEYDYAVERYNRLKGQGKISDIEDVKWQRDLNKFKIQKDYSPEVRDFYKAPKQDLVSMLSKRKDGQKIANQLLEMGDKLTQAGVITKNPFRNKNGLVDFVPGYDSGNITGRRFKNNKSGRWSQQILESSAKRGLDPEAVLAVAAVEGLSGGVGDNGQSFGPFQLYTYGELPKGKDRAWAESPEGIEYALDRIATVAKGLKGRAAIEAIVHKFERPADPHGEVQRALAVYGNVDPNMSDQYAGGGDPTYKGGTRSSRSSTGSTKGGRRTASRKGSRKTAKFTPPVSNPYSRVSTSSAVRKLLQGSTLQAKIPESKKLS